MSNAMLYSMYLARSSVDRFLAAHQSVNVIAFVTHQCAEEHDAEDNVIIKDEEISQTSVIHIGKANDTTEHYHYTGDGIERTLTNLVA